MSDRLDAALVELAAAIRAEIAARPDTDAPERLYAIPEAAALMSCGRSLLYTEMQAGRLRALHVGRRVLIPSGAIRDYIDSAIPAQPTEKGRARRDSARPSTGGRDAARPVST